MVSKQVTGRVRMWAGAALAMTLAGAADASVLWDGDASRGLGVFKLTGTGNCASPSSITAATDSTHGRIWRYNKPSGTNRCENHGIKNGSSNFVFNHGTTYYLGWRSRLSNTSNNNANFQWKSYGTGHQQNFPLVLKMISGQMNLMYTHPGGRNTFLWRRAVARDQWNHFVLGIHVNRGLTAGWVELWFNGARQTFLTGGQRYNGRTLDTGGHNCPKWGVYGASGTAMINYIDGLKVGTTFGDVD
jgi:hypothetical protein